jgi:hypothetical protein
MVREDRDWVAGVVSKEETERQQRLRKISKERLAMKEFLTT